MMLPEDVPKFIEIFDHPTLGFTEKVADQVELEEEAFDPLPPVVELLISGLFSSQLPQLPRIPVSVFEPRTEKLPIVSAK